MKGLAEIVKKFSGTRVLLVGDMAADRYVFGRTARLSREAPVVILEYEEELIKPGQAANAAFNIISLGGEVFPVGVVGDDREGEALIENFKKAGVCTDGIVVLNGQNTTVKTRIWARGHHTAYQQVVRVDKFMGKHIDKTAKGQLMGLIKDAAEDCNALLVSDYGLGVVDEEVRELILSLNLPVIVDSRYNILDFAGATIATPNEEEAAAALNLAGPQELKFPEHGWELKKRLASQALLITQGSFGMSLFDEEYYHIPVFGEVSGSSTNC